MALPRITTAAGNATRKMVSFSASVAAVTVLAISSIAMAVELSGGQREALIQLQQKTTGPVSVSVDPAKGTPRQIKVKGGVVPSANGRVIGSENPRAAAAAFLSENNALLGVENPASEFVLKSSNRDEGGRSHVRYEQTFQGLRVWPAEVVVHLDTNGNVDLVNGTFRKSPTEINTTPTIAQDAAAQLALTAAGLGAGEIEASELLIYSGSDAVRLAWKVEIHADQLTHWVVVIDAHNGSTLTAYNKVCSGAIRGSGRNLFGQTEQFDVWQEGDSFYMINTAKQMFDPARNPTDVANSRGCITILDANHSEFDASGNLAASHVTSGSANDWTLPDAVSAAVGLSQTYDYYLSTFNRNSLDGNGGTIIGIVRYAQGMENAFWNGEVMVFGDGAPFAGALDVVAHELTHGVTQHGSDLIYQDQSGATYMK